MAKSNNRAYRRGYIDAKNGVYYNIYAMSSMDYFYYQQGHADYEESH